ncbi:uncharacterized protein LOC121891725 [Scomber scombrus]|uniref:Uncharacterized protein LOC121891725 n=1 Tax=Scomber scombrus TaxID=13677 RepID=A0AAV1Q6P1_SCOSC
MEICWTTQDIMLNLDHELDPLGSELRCVSDGFLWFLLLKLIMKLLWMTLSVFLVCAEADNMREVKVELGQNATLNCSVDISDMYWYMEIHNKFRVNILRTFGKTGDDTEYCFPEFKTKYSVLENRLVITNVTAEDCRLYFCAQRKNDIIHFEETIQLVSDVSITPSTNYSEPRSTERHIQRTWQSEPVIFTSFALNILLFLIGFCFTYLSLKRNISKYQVNEPSPLTSDTQERLETPQLPETHSECIFYKSQLPPSTLP